MQKPWKYYLIALGVILIDQAFKLWVHFNMDPGLLGQIELIGNWFKLHYTLNPGMAFGIQLGFKYGKLLLTLGRIVATFVIGWYIWLMYQQNKTKQLTLGLWGWSLILGGALGNVIDSVFYAVLLDNAPYDVPMAWFHGQVIDMLYLDIWEMRLPQWIPLVGGEHLTLFPIFNLADVAILLGVAAILSAKRTNIKEYAVLGHRGKC